MILLCIKQQTVPMLFIAPEKVGYPGPLFITFLGPLKSTPQPLLWGSPVCPTHMPTDSETSVTIGHI